MDRIESYNKQEADFFGIEFRPNFVDSRKLKSMKKNYTEYSFVFIGFKGKNCDRLKEFYPIQEAMDKIYPSLKRYAYTQTLTLHTDFIPYEEYLEFVSKSEFIIDMARVSKDEGYSFRIPEALFLEKKVITNRTGIIHEKFYDPSRFFIIGIDPVERIKEFMNIEYKRIDVSLDQFDSKFL